MRRSSIALLVTLALAPRGQAPARDAPAQPVTGSASISGRVVSDDPAAVPLRKARVTMNGTTVQFGRTTTTDDAGAFTFENLPAGRFQLQAAKPGYLTASYGAKKPDRSGTPVTIVDGQRLTALTMKMVRGGVVTGTVLDQRGQPAAGVGVSVLRFGYFALTGERTLGQQSLGGSGVTDDRGVYRAWGLPPGEYVVAVNPDATSGRLGPPGLEEIRRFTPAELLRASQGAQTGRATGPQTARLAPVSYAPVFYPGTSDVALARAITLGAGEEIGGINVQIQLMPTARVEGTATIPAGVEPRSVTLSLALRASNVMMMSSLARSSRLAADGTYVFAGVTPGAYTLTARNTLPAGGAGAPPAAVPRVWALADVVVVDGRDLNVPLELQPAMTVSGRVVLDGVAAPPDLSALQIFLVPLGSGGNLSAGGQEGGQVNADGRFTLTGAIPGQYRYTYAWATSTARRSWSSRAVTTNGRDVLDSPIEIAPGERVDVVMTLTDRPTEIAGALQDTSGRPAPDYFIIIFPADRALWRPASRRVQMTRPGNDGQFLAAMPPGEYYLAALTDVAPNEWFDNAFLEQLVASAAKVTLVEGQRTRQDLRIGGQVFTVSVAARFRKLQFPRR